MTITEAKDLIRRYDRKRHPTEEDDFLFVEALRFLIEELKSPTDMMWLGGWYYERRRFDLALKYYEMAATYNLAEAYACLGYIWYYGRTGEVDYEKAFNYYSLAADAGDLEAAYKVADMYKNGYYVERDFDRYKAIIEDLYLKIKDSDELFSPLPSIFIRLAKIRSSEGKTREAVDLYLTAKDFLAQRLQIDPFFGDFSNMRWLIGELYRLIPCDPRDFDFYDLYHLLTRPNKITFKYEGKTHCVESVMEDGACVICFDEDQWFRTPDDFIKKAVINGRRLTSIYGDLYLFEVN